MTWIEDIGSYLQTCGIGTVGTDIYAQGFNANVTNCITLLTSPGRSETYALGRKCRLSRPELDIRVRNIDDTAAETKAKSIYALLNGITSQHIGSTDFFRIRAQQDPFFVSDDDNNRFIYAINFDIEIEV